MTTNVTAWVQPDPFETSERFNVRGSADTPHSISNLTTPLSRDDYLDYAYNPAHNDRNGMLGEDGSDPQRAWGAESESWLTTPGFGPFDEYRALVRQGLGGSHICNWDPYDWSEALRLQALADFEAAPPPDLADGPVSIEWEGDNPLGPQHVITNPGTYFGTFTNRVLRLTSPRISGTIIDHNGDVSDEWEPPLSSVVALRPDEIPNGASDEPIDPALWTPTAHPGTTGVYGWAYHVTGGAAGWNTSEFDSYAGAVTYNEASSIYGVGELLAFEMLDVEVEVPISDSLWESLKWPMGRFLFTAGEGDFQVTNEGCPLVFGPRNMIDPNQNPYDWPEVEEVGVRGGIVWLDGLYTPPRWRIVYTSSGPGPVTRQQSRDDGRGLSAAPRLVPAPKSARLVGGHQ